MERLDDLALFVEVAERAGFAAAARHLGMQRSKLSRRIGELEERLGVRLLQRNTRSVSLTLAGEQIYRHAHGCRKPCTYRDAGCRRTWTPQAEQLYALLPTRRGNSLGVKLFLEFALPRVREAIRQGSS
jgi:hypothetical protein